jgi:hypothetical protein
MTTTVLIEIILTMVIMTRITNPRMILRHITTKMIALTIIMMKVISLIITFNLVTGMATETTGDGIVLMPVLDLDTDIMIHFIIIVIFTIRFGIQHGAAPTAFHTTLMADTIIIMVVTTDLITITLTTIIPEIRLHRDTKTILDTEQETTMVEEDLITPGLEFLPFQPGLQNV